MSSFPPDSFPPDLARSVAERLAPETDSSLPAMTERALAEQAGAQVHSVPMRTFDPATTIALAALLLGATQFAWSIYRDLKKDRQESQKTEAATPHREVLLRRLRLEFSDTPSISRDRRDRLFEVVVEEVQLRESDG